MLKITTSWDDGDILDKKLIELLSRYSIKGTFYVTKNYRPERLSDENIRDIAQSHEIGAHTLTHPDLRKLAYDMLREEIVGSKKWLEQITKSDVKMFCYPRGLHNEQVRLCTKEGGFVGARTTMLGSTNKPIDLFHINTTIQVYPFPFRKLNQKKFYFRKILEPLIQRAPSLRKLGVSNFAMYSWLSTTKATFDRALKKGEVFHLWGHSWEIEKYGMWGDLEKLFIYIGNRTDCIYVTNSELIQNTTNE